MEAGLRKWRARQQGGAAAVIHRVPASMRFDLSSVEPAVVSVGPYHHGKASLQAMEEHKWASLDAILQLNRKATLDHYLREMAAAEARARSCYSEDTAHMGSQEFAAMLLLDGCFLAALFLEKDGGKGPGRAAPPRWFTPAVARDLLLLENQIPLFAVQKILELCSGRSGSSSTIFLKGVAETVGDLLGLHASMPLESAGLQEHHHLLDLLHRLFFRPVLESDTEASKGSSRKRITSLDGGGGGASCPENTRTMLSLLPSATDLQDAGVKLKKREQRGLLDATFHDSTMEIPFLPVDGFTASLLRNLVAWEAANGGGGVAGNGVTAYVLFMDRLLRTGRDVALLCEKGIVEHRLGGDGEVTALVGGLAAGVPLEVDGGKCHLRASMARLREYQKSNLHKWKARIKKDFSTNGEFYLSLLLDD